MARPRSCSSARARDADRAADARERGRRAGSSQGSRGHLRHSARGADRSRKAPTAIARASPTSTAMVEVVEPAGSDTFVVTKLGGKEVMARLRADADVRAGRRHASPSISTRRCCSIPRPAAAVIADEAVSDESRRHRHHRLGHRRRDDRRRVSPRTGADPDPRARRAAVEHTPETRDARAIFQRGFYPPERDVDRRRGPAASTPATTTMSAATRSSTARC